MALGYPEKELSIHDLTRRSTSWHDYHLLSGYLSIHDLTRRSTVQGTFSPDTIQAFNSRPHKEVDSSRNFFTRHNTSFQFTTSQGGRRGHYSDTPMGTLFQFTTSQGGRQSDQFWVCIGGTFQFTTSQGGRLAELFGNATTYVLSIHDLTRRSTEKTGYSWNRVVFQFTTSQGGRLFCHCRFRYFFNLSIHDLTRRSTSALPQSQDCQDAFNSRPHKEVDGIGSLTYRGTKAFQFTTSQGGRPEEHLKVIHEKFFQFTTSQGGRLGCAIKFNISLPFQFTTSQGGRQSCIISEVHRWNFQFTTSQGGRRRAVQARIQIPSFNSRPHKEVDSARFSIL